MPNCQLGGETAVKSHDAARTDFDPLLYKMMMMMMMMIIIIIIIVIIILLYRLHSRFVSGPVPSKFHGRSGSEPDIRPSAR